MPVHNPPWADMNLSCRFDLVKYEIEVNHTQIIKNIVPFPLEYTGSTIYICLNKVKEFQGNFSEYSKKGDWSEILFQIPVIYQKELYTYNCEGFVNHPMILIANRELFGYPKILADVDIIKTNEDFNGTASYYGQNQKICSLSFKPLRKGSLEDVGKNRTLINLKFIPSCIKNHEPDVKKLVAMKYSKTLIHNLIIGKGTVDLHEHCPKYIIDAGIKAVKKSVYIDLELIVDQGTVIYDYLQKDN